MDKLVRQGIGLVLVVFGLGFAGQVFAQTPAITLTAPAGQLRAGEEVPVIVQTTSFGTSINAAEVTLRYNPALLQVVRVERTASALTLWPEEPTIDAAAGTIHFVGGRPGGFIALDVTLVTVVVVATNGGSANLTVDTGLSRVYRNDGVATAETVPATSLTLVFADQLVGTIAVSSSTHATASFWSNTGTISVSWTPKNDALYSYSLDTNPSTIPDDVPDSPVGTVVYNQKNDGVWYFSIKEQPSGGSWSQPVTRRFLIDTTAPQAFTLLHPLPSDVGGQNLLTWNALDAVSGVVRSSLTVDGTSIGDVTSPLHLKNAWKGKTLVVTVYDAAGNSTSAQYVWATTTRGFMGQHRTLFFGGSVVLAGALLIGWLLLRKRG